MFLTFNVSGRRSLRADSEAGVALMLMIAHYANRSAARGPPAPSAPPRRPS